MYVGWLNLCIDWSSWEIRVKQSRDKGTRDLIEGKIHQELNKTTVFTSTNWKNIAFIYLLLNVDERLIASKNRDEIEEADEF